MAHKNVPPAHFGSIRRGRGRVLRLALDQPRRALARLLLPEKVDLAIGFDNSSVALAVEQVAYQKNRIAIAGAIGTTAFTGKACTPNEAAWVYDAYALTNTLARSVVKRGQDTWYFITVDYSLGHSLEADATNAVVASGGKVLGSARHPLNTDDFSAYLLQAQARAQRLSHWTRSGSWTDCPTLSMNGRPHSGAGTVETIWVSIRRQA